MALRRISQLDPVLHSTVDGYPQHEESLENAVIKPDPSLTLADQIAWFVRNNPFLSGYLMEVSEWNGIKANAPSYYLSKQFDLSSLITIISASITGSLDEMTTFNDYECEDQLLCSLSTNAIYRKYDHYGKNDFHNETEFHNDVIITGKAAYPDGQLSGVMTTGKQSWSAPVLKVKVPSIFTYPINACAMSAWWADLAEVYDADEDYAPGTLVQFGGEKEITVASVEANAVVTTSPGFILNAGDGEYTGAAADGEHKVAIALTGRTPVLVSGPVKKFDRIGLDKKSPGVGCVLSETWRKDAIAVALESNDEPGVKLVMCSTKFTF